MTPEEIQKRNGKANNIRVIQTEDGDLFASSDEGMILYKVNYVEGKESHCTCGDFARGSKNDPNFKCKHVLAVIQSDHDAERARILERVQPKLDPKYLVTIDGQTFVRYAGLISLAHAKKLQSLKVEILQMPTNENAMTAICRAHARTALGDSFVDVADANPSNCTFKVAKALVRMASTRAKARALRDLTAVGDTCFEEVDFEDEVVGAEEKGTAQRHNVKLFRKKIVKEGGLAAQPGNGNGKGTPPTDPVKDVKTDSSATTPGNMEASQRVKESSTDERKTVTVKRIETKAPEKSGNSNQGKGKVATPALMSEAQKRAVYNLSRRRGISLEELEKMSKDSYGVPLENLSASDASSFIRQLQQSA